jgi:protein-S-isoprenylcysteine O-methyltransferase Ste14
VPQGDTHTLDLQLPTTLIHWLLAGAAIAVLTFFAAGLTLYFERAPRPPWVIALHYGSTVLALAQTLGVIFLPQRSENWVGAAVVMYFAAVSVFLSAIESAKRTRLQRSFVDHPLPERLIADGPYKWVRHPFCTGYLLAALAGPVAIDHIAMLVIALPLVMLSIYAALREERVWLSGRRGDEYRAYRRRTGMFIPFVGRG